MSVTAQAKQCGQAGYLPVPLTCVPPESLSGLNIYLNSKGNYSLYTALGHSFGPKDVQRLLASKVEYVYVTVQDHQVYYQTIEAAIDQIISDPSIQAQKKSEILYATSLELSSQLLSAPPGKEEIRRASNLSQATVELILRDQGAFGRLYEVFSHDFYTVSHLVNVCSLTIMLAQKMNLVDAELLQQLGTGGLLHDVGKIFLPSDILNTPKRLTKEQYETIKGHVELGCSHLEKVMTMAPAMRSVVAEHHERMDGSGYPKALKGSEISSLGRLAGVVDTFDAMTSVRPYRNSAFSVAETLEQLESESPTKYDPEIVNAFISLVQSAQLTEPAASDAPGATAPHLKLNMASWGAAHTQYYFRMQVTARKAKKDERGIRLLEPQKVLSHKVSCMGFGFLSDRQYAAKEVLFISSPLLAPIGLNDFWVQVISCNEHRGGWYTIETRFLDPKSPEEIARVKEITTVRESSPLVEN